MKLIDDDRELHTIKDNHLLTVEEKTYSGIRTVEHLYQINLGGKL